MDKITEVAGRLSRVLSFSDISFDRGGHTFAVTVQPPQREAGQSYQSRIWRYGLDGKAVQLTFGPNGDHLPRCSPVDDRIAFASDRARQSKADLYLLADGQARAVGRIPGTVESLAWTSDGSALIVLAADAGLDAPATSGAMRCWWDGVEDPARTSPSERRRRLFRVWLADGATAEVGPRDATVWEFDLMDDGAAVILTSEDPSERGWYHARLARVDFATRDSRVLHRSPWQLQGACVSPDGRHLAFLEGWSSDRGLVAGEMRLLDLKSGAVRSLAAETESGVTSLAWRDDDSLWFAGWSRLGSVYGVVQLDGRFEWRTREDATIGPSSFFASITQVPGRPGAFTAVREAPGVPPEVVLKTAPGADWAPVTAVNAAVMADYPDYPEVRELRWTGRDGLAVEGLVLLPRDRGRDPLPTVVDIHGGPTWAAKHAFNPGYGLHHAATGCAVFLPNYRGSAGWGQAYSRLNIGDPGGAEFDDILAGVDACIAAGIADPDRLGVTGVSYGGYMTAWAVARSDRFRAAVMISGISNQWSCHYSCNHDFCEFIVGGKLTDPARRALALERSALYRLDRPTTPTLILHGELDRCTPLGQGQEFYSALVERGVPAELVVYPREGHGWQERAHLLDAAQRSAAWFRRHLGES